MKRSAIFTPPPCPARRSGFTLLEIMVVIAALGLIMLLGTVTLLGTMRIERATESVFHRLSAHADLSDQFRLDVARANAAPDKLEKLVAGPTCLLLRLADGHHVAYRFEAGVLTRSELDGASTTQRTMPLGSELVRVEFGRAESAPKMITLRLTEPPGRTLSRHPIEITATMGGDLR